jgi:hypothetical protein
MEDKESLFNTIIKNTICGLLVCSLLSQAGGYITSVAHFMFVECLLRSRFPMHCVIGSQVASFNGGDESLWCFCAEVTTAYSIKHVAGTCGIPALFDPHSLPVCSWSSVEQLGSGNEDLRLRMDLLCFSVLGWACWKLRVVTQRNQWHALGG